MPNISLTAPSDYGSQLATLQRQQQLAAALQQLSDQPIQASSAGGITAPISPIAALSKALSGFGGSYEAAKAAQTQTDLKKSDLAEALKAVRTANNMPTGLGPQGSDVGTVDTSGIEGAGPSFPITGGRPVQTGAPTPDWMMQQGVSAMQGGPISSAVGGELFNKASDLQQKQSLLDMQTKQDQAIQPPPGTDPKVWAALGQIPGGRTKYMETLGTETAKNIAPQKPNPNQPFNSDGKPNTAYQGYQEKLIKDRATATANATVSAMQQTPITVDHDSQSLLAQTGLSQAAIDRLTGAPNQPRSTAFVNQVNNEITRWSVKNGINLATLRNQALGIGQTIQQNTLRNNQANILESEITGSMQTISPVLDSLKNRKLNVKNVADIWAGKQVNDGLAIQAADQLVRFRNELASYNAVAGGHLNMQGAPDPRPEDYKQAENTILGGINSGGAKSVAESVARSAQKNRAVLASSIDDANKKLWDLFGVGQHYKRTSTDVTSADYNNAATGNNAAPAGIPHGWTLHQDAKGNKAYVSPDGKQFQEAK